MNINRVTLIGNLTKDVELKYSKDGKAIGKFSIAVNGMDQNDVSFFNIVVFGKAAENCSQYLSKGKKVGIDGRLKQNRWQGDDGKPRSTIDIIASSVEFLSSVEKSPAQTPAEKTSQDFANDDFYDNTGFDPITPEYDQINNQDDVPF